MSLLAHVPTGLGRVELHHEGGRFETRGLYVNVLTGAPYPTVIPLFRDGACEWYELAEREGHVYQPFPRETATSERTPA